MIQYTCRSQDELWWWEDFVPTIKGVGVCVIVLTEETTYDDPMYDSLRAKPGEIVYELYIDGLYNVLVRKERVTVQDCKKILAMLNKVSEDQIEIT